MGHKPFLKQRTTGASFGSCNMQEGIAKAHLTYVNYNCQTILGFVNISLFPLFQGSLQIRKIRHEKIRHALKPDVIGLVAEIFGIAEIGIEAEQM
jgi:hypothetical protein